MYCHLIFREGNAELQVLIKQKYDLVFFYCIFAQNHICVDGLGRTCPCLQKLLYIEYFMKSCVESQFLMNACGTSAALQLHSQEELFGKTNVLLCFQLLCMG